MKSDQHQKDIDTILNSKKYRSLNIPRETLEDLFASIEPKVKSHKDLLKQVRHKLHNIVAPYLGDPDYAQSILDLEAAFLDPDDDSQIKSICQRILESHSSTRERIPYLQQFYSSIFKITGTPQIILDLACGLNPISLRWMDMHGKVQYHAYDMHHPRIDLINRYFELEGLPTLAEHRDILVDPPETQADLAFFFKEAHRFEQRRHGCNRDFWQALNVEHLVVSLPAASLDGKRNLTERQYRLVANTIENLPYDMVDLSIGNEIVFIISK